jgi:hypothetical protein
MSMKLTIGFIKSESQFLLKELNTQDQSITSKVLDTIEIKETPLNLLMFSGENSPGGLQKTLEAEQKFYPIISGDSLGLSHDIFESDESFFWYYHPGSTYPSAIVCTSGK